ncbi:hypothetical protein ACOMHN_061196 [Nucella lapillus]
MYGQIHVVVKEMVLEKYGRKVWNTVLEQCGLDEEKDFLQFTNYPDHSSFRLLAAVPQCVEESQERVLEMFGDYFVRYCLDYGYDSMLRTLGADIVAFIQNLDSLHSLLSLTYRGIVPPSFRCEQTADGGLLLHYHSSRSGLAPLVVGLINAVGRELFGHEVALRVLRTEQEDMGTGVSQEHTVFAVHVPHSPPQSTVLREPGRSSPVSQSAPPTHVSQSTTPIHVSNQSGTPTHISDQLTTVSQTATSTHVNNQPASPTYVNKQSATLTHVTNQSVTSIHGGQSAIPIHINNQPVTSERKLEAPQADNMAVRERSPECVTMASSDGCGPGVAETDAVTLTGPQFCTTFPYHVFFTPEMTIMQLGHSLTRVLSLGIGVGSGMSEAFHIEYPRVAWSLNNILRFINTIFILSLLPTPGSNKKCLKLKGQMLWLEGERRLLFMGSPSLKSLKEMRDTDLHMADIPLFDVTREIVLLYQQRNAEIGITQMLDQTTAELKRTWRALEEERQKTEQLLNQMLPPRVARQLKLGLGVEAETFQTATVQFSDVVSFTSIAAICPPENIVDMLNDMYERFDNATTKWNVYKGINDRIMTLKLQH